VAALPVFVLAVPLVVVAVTGRFRQVTFAGAGLAGVGAVALFAFSGHGFADALASLALALLGMLFWTAGAAVGWLSWERRQRESA
jgi:hypothetical protein